MKSTLNNIMQASFQRNSITDEMQLTKRCYEENGKVSQQGILLEEYPIDCPGVFLFHSRMAL